MGLVDIRETPIKRITPNGHETSDAAFDFDIIVFATGFDALTGAFDRIDFRGVDGLKLKDKWAHGPQTWLGIMVEGFPNMMMQMGPHTALGNIPRSIEYSVEWVSGLLRYDLRGQELLDSGGCAGSCFLALRLLDAVALGPGWHCPGLLLNFLCHAAAPCSEGAAGGGAADERRQQGALCDADGAGRRRVSSLLLAASAVPYLCITVAACCLLACALLAGFFLLNARCCGPSAAQSVLPVTHAVT